ncbi:MAG TPA: CBS domain-containing protein [Bacteroidia bacterium]|jgi:CBS domain-containing protein|nr:CBS domain-containing protein [Bacteroidia bacterium]
MKTVREIMVAEPQQCSKNDTLKQIASRMEKANIGCLPVVDEARKVVGIITDRDIALTLHRSNKPLSELKVHEVMTKEVHAIRPEEHTDTALRIMRTRKVGRLPVVDGDFKLKGMVSLNRILRNTHGSSEASELEYAGEENVLNTLHSIAERNSFQGREN